MSPNLQLQAALTSIIQHLLSRLNSNLTVDDTISFINSYTSGEDLTALTDKYINLKPTDLSTAPQKDSSGKFGSEF